MMNSLPLSGKIQDTPLPMVIEGLRQSRATGTLTLLSKDIKKAVHFKDGQIIFATSNEAQDRLGETLVKSGKLSREHLDLALNMAKKSAGFKKLGALLVENGFVSPKDLFIGLKIQVKGILYSLFLWTNADYHFENRLPSDVIQLQINMQELITEIIQRIKQES